jgi:hypothetical protein
MTAGFDVFVQLVIAAITTAPSSISNRSPLRSDADPFGQVGPPATVAARYNRGP